MNEYGVNVLDVVARTRSGAWRETRWLAGHVAVSALVLTFAVVGLPDLGPWLLWFLVGLAFADVVSTAGRVWAAWQEVRRLVGCADCRILAAAVDLAVEAYGGSRVGCSVEHTRWGG